jgi:hypothetical protein
MPGITRIKTWVAKEVLVYSDLNNEFDNIINNLQASNVDGYSSSVAQMQETTDPGDVGTESLALRISDEIERLRFAISRIVGKTYWYEPPARSLSTTYVNAENYLSPNDSLEFADVVSEFVSAGFIDSFDFADPFFYSSGFSNKKFFDTKYSLQNNVTAPRFFWVSPVSSAGGSSTISVWFRNFAANDTIYFNMVSGLRVSLDSNGYLSLEQAVANATVNGSKTIYSITGTSSLAGNSNFQNVIVRWRYNAGSIDSKVEMLLNGTLVGSTVIGTSAVNIPPTNSAPCLMGSRAFSTFLEALTNPGTSDPTTYSWTPNGTLTSVSVSNGVLTVDPVTAGNTAYYSRAVFSGAIPTDGVFFECKYRLRNTTLTTVGPQTGSHFGFYFRLDTGNIGFHCRINGGSITFDASTSAIAITGGSLLAIDHNSNEWTNIAVIVRASISYVYINGMMKGSFVTPTSDTTAADLFAFGKVLTGTSYSLFDVEYLYLGNASSGTTEYIVPNNTNTQYVSDFCHIKGFLTDQTTISALQTSSPYLLFGRPAAVRGYASNRSFISSLSAANGVTQFLGEVCKFVSDGRTPVKLDFRVNVRQAAATNGTYNFAAYLNIRNVSSTATGNQFINQTGAASGLTAGVSLMDAMVQVIPATSIPQLLYPLKVSYCEVLPAGVYLVFGYVANLSSPAALTVQQVKCTASL